MWTSTNIITYKKQFDFTESEQGKPSYTSLKIDNKDFINIIEALEGELDDSLVLQTIICDHCGCYGCSSGSWIAIRQSSNFIFFIPAFEDIRDEPDLWDYDPPYLLEDNGAFWLSVVDFAKFKKLVPELDKQNSINQLSHYELISLYKWDTPHSMFGEFPNFESIKKNHVLVVSELDNETIFEILENKLIELENSNDFEIKALADNDKVVSIFLDDSSTTEWKALCKTDNEYFLLLGGTFKILPK